MELQSDVNNQLLVIENVLKANTEKVNSENKINKVKFDIFTHILAFHINLVETLQGELELEGRPQNKMKLQELKLELESLIEIGNRKITEQNN